MNHTTKGFMAFVALAMATVASAEMMAQPLVQANWPGISTVWQDGTMYMSSAPTEQGLKHARVQGITTVINLMESGEIEPQAQSGKDWFGYLVEYFLNGLKGWDEATTARALGMRYEHIPISVDAPTDEGVARFLAIVKEVDAKNLLIHCDVAGRALAMYAIYLGTAEGYTPEAALARAESAGLTHEGLKQFVLDYLKQHVAVT
jgi:protein tyrosine phosphatase (PTP) superfamily phosphohydrolase (DUF442 family)